MSRILIFNKEGEKVFQGEGTIASTPLNAEMTEEDYEEPKMSFSASVEFRCKKMVKKLEVLRRNSGRIVQERLMLDDDRAALTKFLLCLKYGDRPPRKYRRKYPFTAKYVMAQSKRLQAARRCK